MSNKINDVALNKQDASKSAIPLTAKKRHRLLKSAGITIIGLSGLAGLGILGGKRRLF